LSSFNLFKIKFVSIVNAFGKIKKLVKTIKSFRFDSLRCIFKQRK